MAPSVSGRLNPVALVYPKNPLNLSVPVVNISPLLVEVCRSRLIFDLWSLSQAGNRVRAMGGDTDRINLSVWDAPFFMSPTKWSLISDDPHWSLISRIGFFTDRSGMLTVDPSLIVICDIEFVSYFDLWSFPLSRSASISIERSKPDVVTNFPFTKDGRHPYDLRSFTGSRDHVCYLIFGLWSLSSHIQLGLIVSHRCSANSWRTVVGSITDRLSRVIY